MEPNTNWGKLETNDGDGSIGNDCDQVDMIELTIEPYPHNCYKEAGSSGSTIDTCTPLNPEWEVIRFRKLV
jgi:hypothetical protein